MKSLDRSDPARLLPLFGRQTKPTLATLWIYSKVLAFHATSPMLGLHTAVPSRLSGVVASPQRKSFLHEARFPEGSVEPRSANG